MGRWCLAILAGVAVVGMAGCHGLGSGDRMWECDEMNAAVRQAMGYTYPQGKVLWDSAARPPVEAPPPAEWTKTFMGSMSGPGETMLFLHERTTPSGAQRLVVISLVPPRSGHGQHLSTLMVEPGNLTRWPRHHGPDLGLDLQALPAKPVRFYAGQVDPADPSHFTIEFDAADGRGRHTIDGWLRDTAEPAWDPVGVRMEVRAAKAEEQ